MYSESLRAKLARYSSPPDAEGHVLWTGKTGPADRPLIRFRRRDIPTASVAFEQRTGREPQGMCRAECGVRNCVAPTHVADDMERRAVRLQLRDLYGLDAPWVTCPKGLHGWAENGRVEPNLTLYCRACNTNRARTSRDKDNAS